MHDSKSGRVSPADAAAILLAAALIGACAAGGATHTATTLASLTAACAARDSAGLRDTSPTYESGAATTHAVPYAGNRMPTLGRPGHVVVARFVVDTLGRPDLCNARVERESRPGLGDELLAAAADWRFTPATYQGRKVRELTTIVLESKAGR